MKVKGNKMTEYENGISITNQCYDCMLADAICTDCQDLADARLTDKAHELVDEGNLQYARPWLLITEPSAHDWTSPVTELLRPAIQQDGTIKYDRQEYLPPIVQLQDGGVYEELWELDDYAQSQRERQCQWCNILTPKVFNDCQSCDKPLEHNLI
jgi:hypothetical protein